MFLKNLVRPHFLTEIPWFFPLVTHRIYAQQLFHLLVRSDIMVSVTRLVFTNVLVISVVSKQRLFTFDKSTFQRHL
jgi:hypothetical protein